MGLNMVVIPLAFLLFGLINGFPDDPTLDFELLDYSTNVDDPKYRLLDNVRPKYFHVDLDVYLSQSRFNGLVQARVEVLENLTQIVMHQKVQSISAVNVVDEVNQPVAIKEFVTNSYFEIMTINFVSTITPGEYTITVSYIGRINENPHDRGFYKGYYYIGNEKREYATTQFQPYHARKAFPCFDEPQFKNPYVISITRDSYLRESYSNMAIAKTETLQNRVRETFLPTPVISAYLIAFHVSDFVATNFTGTAQKPFQIISREGALNQHNYAAEVGVKITAHMDEFFDINYYGMGQGQPMKNDHIALPDFPSGAMENWGMVNYREAYLLYDDKHTNVIDQIFIATIMAHELAHKWFGNLVTCFWWSNLWLNESFASYFEYFSAHQADAALDIADRFVTSHVQRALTADAGASITPMNWTEVSNTSTITSHFGTSSYVKGASVLRMLEHFVGYTTFRNALRNYLKDNLYGVGYPVDMYNAFRKAVAEDSSFQKNYPNVDIGTVFESWVQNPGSPVVNVNVNMSSGVINIKQERFQLSGTPRDTIWHLPLTWTHGGKPNFENLKPSLLLSTKTTEIQKEIGHHWVIFNNQHSGLYRVNYDDHNWEMIAAQLRNNRNVIHKLNRAQIITDVLFFVRAGKISIKRAFDVLSYLKQESDYYAWNHALTQLDWIRRRLEHLPVAYEQFTKYLLVQMQGAIDQLGYEERSNDTASIIQSRMQIMNYACQLGHDGCITDSLNQWRQFRTNENYLVPKNARRYVYCTGLREGNASDFQFLFNKYNISENTADMVVMLRALGCTKDPISLKIYLEQSMHNDKIRVHDRNNAFSFALQGNRENLRVVLNFLYNNYRDIRASYGGPARLTTSIQALATYFTDFNDILDFQTWLYGQQIGLEASFSAGVGVINSALSNLRWGNNAATEIFEATRVGNSTASIAASIGLLLIALTAQLLR